MNGGPPDRWGAHDGGGDARPGQTGRHYRLPTDATTLRCIRPKKAVADILDEWERGGKQGLCPVPDEPAPTKDTLVLSGVSFLCYGMLQWGDLFTARQKVALVELLRLE